MELQTLKILSFVLVFVLVGIVVLVLNKNTLVHGESQADQITRLDNKVNWLYYLFLSTISILVFLFVQIR
jgi:hypothetical protein